MKFILFKLSALALVATSKVSAEMPALRGSSEVVATLVEDVDVKLPEFFPKDLTEDQIISFKQTAAQKRQAKRDARRAIDNPDRTQEEENKERARKTRQSRKRGNIDVDPYSGGGSRDFGRDREAKRAVNCERNGEGCNYSGANQDCYNDCVDDGSLSDRVCARKCEYIDAQCNEDCRDDGGSIGECLDDCQKNVDTLNDDDRFDNDRARDRRNDNGNRRSKNRSNRRDDRQDRIDKYGSSLSTSFDEDRARDRRNDNSNRRSKNRSNRRDDRQNRNDWPPAGAPVEEKAKSDPRMPK